METLIGDRLPSIPPDNDNQLTAGTLKEIPI